LYASPKHAVSEAMDRITAMAREGIEQFGGTMTPLPEDAFKEAGTSESVVLMVVDVPTLAEGMPAREWPLLPGAGVPAKAPGRARARPRCPTTTGRSQERSIIGPGAADAPEEAAKRHKPPLPEAFRPAVRPRQSWRFGCGGRLQAHCQQQRFKIGRALPASSNNRRINSSREPGRGPDQMPGSLPA
jgi:hypothetical protein